MTWVARMAGAARFLGLIFVLAALTACATGPNAHPLDPFEPFNRSVSRFNDELDRTVLKPVATGYKEAVPAFVRTSVSNFFNNISDVWSFINVEFGARADPLRRFSDVPLRNSLYGLRVVDKRANLLNAAQVLDGAALDKYTFTRDVFLQIRRREVNDGKDEDVDPDKDGPADSDPKSGLSPAAPAVNAAPATPEVVPAAAPRPVSDALPPSSEPLEQARLDASAAE